MGSNLIELPSEIQSIKSAWKGHEQFAFWLINKYKPKVIVDLGVDYGYSTFCLAVPNIGKVYGIDHFVGDTNAGHRNTYKEVIERKKILSEKYKIDNIEIMKADFIEAASNWEKPIDVLHIDGCHRYSDVIEDYEAWLPHLREKGILLMHDLVSYPGVKKVYDESDLSRCYFTHSHGLGVLSRDKQIIEEIASEYGLSVA